MLNVATYCATLSSISAGQRRDGRWWDLATDLMLAIVTPRQGAEGQGSRMQRPAAIIALVFRCKITGGALAVNDEAAGFRWATETEVPGLMNEAYAVRVLDALHDTATAAVRPHDGLHLL